MQQQSMLLAHLQGRHIYVSWHSWSGNIPWLLAGKLEVGAHIFQLAHLECTYINCLSAGTLEAGAHICQLACLKQRHIYVSPHMLSTQDISGPICYMQLKGIISAEIGW